MTIQHAPMCAVFPGQQPAPHAVFARSARGAGWRIVHSHSSNSDAQ